MPTYPSSINRQTTIAFPLNNNRTAITTGIETGSLYINKLLFTKQLNFGEANSDRFEVTLFGCDDISGETIQVYQTDYANPNNPVVTNLFYGVVDSCKKEDNEVNRRLVAYDPMYKIGNQDATEWWNTYWEDKISDTVSNILTDLLYSFSVTLSSDSTTLLANIDTADLTIMQFSGFQAITFGTILSYLCQALMCNPHFNAEGELDLIVLGARFTGNIVSVTDSFEDENSHFEDYVTEPITRVVIYGETDTIAGEYGSGDNVYVIKGNPLLYNLVDTDYNDLAQTIYENIYNAQASTGYVGVCYTPANIKMIVSSVGINLGDIASATIGSSTVTSVISSIELSGPMLIEQTITSSGNQKLTPDDFNDTSSTAGRALEQATTTSRHFVWVPNSGAYVTTDNTPAGQAPTTNYTKLTEQGLYVATYGKEVAHFGVDDNNDPVAILGSTDAGNTSLILSSEGILAGRQITDTLKNDYFSVNVPPIEELYRTIPSLELITETNRGYVQLPSQNIYLDVARMSWGSPFQAGGQFAAELTHTKKGFDIFVDTLFSMMFRGISQQGLTDTSTLREWFVAYGISSSSTGEYITIVNSDNTTTRIEVYFLGSGGQPMPFNLALYVQLICVNTNLITADNFMSSTEYSYDITNPNQINIIDYDYYNSTERAITSYIGQSPLTLYVAGNAITFDATMLLADVTYQATLGQSVDTNQGVNAVVIGDGNSVTDDSQVNVCVIGLNNSVDNDRFPNNNVLRGCYIFGNQNTIQHQQALVFGMYNNLTGKAATEGHFTNNAILGSYNTIAPTSGSYSSDNVVLGNSNTVNTGNSVAIGENNTITKYGKVAVGKNLNVIGTYNALITLGQFNSNPSSDVTLAVGNGTSASSKHNAMEVGDNVIVYPLTTNALIFDSGGVDRGVNFRYQNDAGGTNANFIRLVPTGTSNGAIMGMSAGGITVVGGGESVATIVNDPTIIGLTTASEALVASADSSILFISNAGTIANYKRIVMGSDGLFQIDECSGTGINLAYFDNSGKLKRDGRSFYAKGDSFSGWGFSGLGGHLTSSQKEVTVFLPMPFPPSLISTSGLTLKMTIRHANGGYPYIYNSSTQINGTNVVNNGTKMSGLSTVSFDSRSISGMSLHLTFANALQRSASSTSTAITNNTPLAISLEMSGSFVST